MATTQRWRRHSPRGQMHSASAHRPDRERAGGAGERAWGRIDLEGQLPEDSC
jgi:hypothetical protein